MLQKPKRFARILLAASALALCAPMAATAESMTQIAAQQGVETPNIDELIAKMTLDEKLAQISCIWFDKAKILEQDGSFNPEKMVENFPHGVGCIARPQDTIGMEEQGEERDVNDSTVVRRMSARTPSETVNLINSIQKWMIEETRLGIPTLFHEEGLHGFQGRYGTSFPQSISLAATFNPELAEEIFSIVAREIRVRGAHHVLSPVVDVARDARWGRIEETYGEDPYLVSRMGVAAVKGFQGDSFPIADDKVLATLKHMTGHGQPESGMNIGPAQLSERELREIFFPPFEAAIKEGNAASVMASYNEIDGVPSHASTWLLGDILRGEWDFSGAVVADYFAINELNVRHRIASNLVEAGALALKAGVDLELPDGVAYYALKDKITAGEISMDIIDQSVRRILEMKVRGNVWATPYADPEKADALTGNDEARALALKAAHQAAVLLKNDDNMLPLNVSDYKKIAVIGPNSDITVLGGYSDEPRQTISILDGVKAHVGDKAEVLHAKGVTLTDNRSWWDDKVNLIDREENLKSIEAAVRVAEQADLVILAIGGDESTSREAWSETHMGDRADITLIGEQKELVEALAKTGKPMATVIISGRPLALANVQDNLPSILYGWILGQETGTAVADILFGQVNPSGKLPVTLPRSVGHLPHFYNHKPTARRGFAFGDATALYPFGYGLSYTDFDYSRARLSKSTISAGESVDVKVRVRNTGKRAGDEVVQVYVRDELASVTRPVKALKGFQRVSLRRGQSKTVNITLPPAAFEMWDIDMKRVIEPGEFTIMVGGNSVDLTELKLEITD